LQADATSLDRRQGIDPAASVQPISAGIESEVLQSLNLVVDLNGSTKKRRVFAIGQGSLPQVPARGT
jgi:hypothetical protein